MRQKINGYTRRRACIRFTLEVLATFLMSILMAGAVASFGYGSLIPEAAGAVTAAWFAVLDQATHRLRDIPYPWDARYRQR